MRRLLYKLPLVYKLPFAEPPKKPTVKGAVLEAVLDLLIYLP